MNIFKHLLKTEPYLMADGAVGTNMMALGLTQGDPPESWNTLHPERVSRIHREFIEAGSRVILTNSFGGTRFRLKLHNLQGRVRELNLAAARLARQAADRAPIPVAVGGSIGPSGEILEPLGDLTFEQAREGFTEQAAALIEGGVDVLWIETMSDLKEVRAAAEGARLAGDTPLVITMTFDTNGYTMMGVSPVQALEAIREYEPLAIGGNCGNGPGEIEGVIRAMASLGLDVPLVAKSNAGIPELVDGHPHYNANPETMADHAVHVRNLGATIIGGCCGNTVEHVRAMAQALAENPTIRAAVVAPNGRQEPKVKRERKHSRGRRVRRPG